MIKIFAHYFVWKLSFITCVFEVQTAYKLCLNNDDETDDDTTTDSVNDDQQDVNKTVVPSTSVVIDDYEILDKKDCDPLSECDDDKFLSFDDAKLRLASMFQVRIDVMERFRKDVC